MNSRGAFGVQADIGMRGSTFSQVAVLLDGIRINDPLTAHFNSNIPIPLSEIDHIEIIRGSGSMAYGADAVGGVIHIHSKTFSGGTEKEGISSTGEISYGQFDLSGQDISTKWASKKFSLHLGLKLNSADGQTFDNPNYTGPGSTVSEESSYFFNLSTYTLSSQLDLGSGWRLAGRGAFEDRTFNGQFFYTRSSFDESVETTETGWGQLRLSKDSEKSNTQIDLGLRSTDDLFVFNPLFSANKHRTRRKSISVDHRFELGNSSQVSIGTLASKRDIRSSDRGDHDDENVGVYAAIGHRIGDDTRVNSGVRMEYDSNFGTELVPHFGLNHHFDKFILRAEANRSVRAGDYTERFISHEIPNLSAGRNLGNPELKVETGWNFSLGSDFRLIDGVDITVDGFLRSGKNMIDFILTESSDIQNADNIQDSVSYFYTQNVSEIQTMGIEIYAGKKWVLSEASQLNAGASITWLESTVPDGTQVSKYLANHPRLDANFNIGLRINRLNVSLIADYIERQGEQVEAINASVNDEYLVGHAQVGYSFKNGLGLIFRMHNALDTDYQEILGAQMPGRWMMTGITWSINQD